LRALRENDQPLEAARLFMQIRDRVAAEAAQTPQYGPMRNAGHDGGDFIFARSAGGAR
jgi:plasmid stabilization system protein ParE